MNECVLAGVQTWCAGKRQELEEKYLRQVHPSGTTSIACYAKGEMCVELGILFRGDPKPEINQLMAK